MNKKLFIAMFTVITQTHAISSLKFINDDPDGVRSPIPPCVILHNDKVEQVSPQGTLTISLNPQQSITLLRPLTNLMATNTYYKFTATLTTTEPDAHGKTFEAHSHDVFDFSKTLNGIDKYSIMLNEHTTLEVQSHPEVRLVNNQFVEIQN